MGPRSAGALDLLKRFPEETQRERASRLRVEYAGAGGTPRCAAQASRVLRFTGDTNGSRGRKPPFKSAPRVGGSSDPEMTLGHLPKPPAPEDQTRESRTLHWCESSARTAHHVTGNARVCRGASLRLRRARLPRVRGLGGPSNGVQEAPAPGGTARRPVRRTPPRRRPGSRR